MRPRFVRHPNEHLNLINHVIYLHNLELDVISFHVLTQIKIKKMNRIWCCLNIHSRNGRTDKEDTSSVENELMLSSVSDIHI